jgi:hypothetical protein
MRINQLFSVLLIICLQWILMGSGGMSTNSVVAIPFLLLALLLPLLGHVWVLRNAQVGLRMPNRAVRFTVVGLTASLLSLSGFVVGLLMLVGGVRTK